MTQDQFLQRLSEEVQLDRAISAEEMLCDIPEWDSLAMLATLNVFDESGISIEIDDLESCKSVRDILVKAGF